MADRELYDLALMLLDRQLIDSDGRHCGKVDDLAIEGGPGEQAKVRAIVCGPSTWRSGTRGPIATLLGKLSAEEAEEIPLEKVEKVNAKVELKETADQLGLNHGERRAARWLSGWPGS